MNIDKEDFNNSNHYTNDKQENQIWKYEMRRTIQEIIPGLFLGPFYCTKNVKLLKENKITHILGVHDFAVIGKKKVAPSFYSSSINTFTTTAAVSASHNDFITMEIKASDNPLEILIPHFPIVKKFIDQALQCGGKVLVHSTTGISRGPAFVIAYLMETQNLSYDEAFHLVQSKRFCIKPNLGFELQLKEYEPIFKARQNINKLNYTTEQIFRQGERRRPAPTDSDFIESRDESY